MWGTFVRGETSGFLNINNSLGEKSPRDEQYSAIHVHLPVVFFLEGEGKVTPEGWIDSTISMNNLLEISYSLDDDTVFEIICGNGHSLFVVLY